MKIKVKITILLGMTVSLFFLTAFLFKYFQTRQASILTEQKRSSTATEIEMVLQSKTGSARALAYEYSSKDAVVKFAEKKDFKLAARNIYPSLSNSKAAAEFIYDKNFKLIGSARSYSKGVPELRVDELSFSKEKLKEELLRDNISSFFALAGGELVQIFAASIHPSSDIERRTPALGYFLVAKVWDKGFISEISEFPGRQASIIIAGTSASENIPKDTAEYFFVKKELNDSEGKKVASAIFKCSFSDVRSAVGVAGLFYGSLILALALFMFMLSTALYVWILKPLAGFTKAMKNQNKIQIENFKKRKDEFGVMAGCIGKYLEDKKKLESEIAGFAEADKVMKAREGLSASLSSKKGLKEILGAFFYEALKSEGVDSGEIYLYDFETGSFELFLHKGFSDTSINSCGHYDKSSPMALIFSKGEPVFSKYSYFLKTLKLFSAGSCENLKALAVIPVKTKGKLIAALNLFSHNFEEFTESSKSRIRALADETCAAIERAVSDLEEIHSDSERKYREVFISSPETIAIFDPEGFMLELNKAAEDLTGYKAEEILGRKYTDFPFLSESAKNDLGGLISEMLSGRLSSSIRELEITKKDGARAYVVAKSGLLREKDGSKKIMAVMADVTEKKNADFKMKELDDMKLHFISRVSHEMKTPLTAIKEGIGIVADGTAGELNEEQEEFLQVAERNVERLTRLISDVLDFQQSETDKMQPDKKPYDFKSN